MFREFFTWLFSLMPLAMCSVALMVVVGIVGGYAAWYYLPADGRRGKWIMATAMALAASLTVLIIIFVIGLVLHRW